MRAKDTAKGKQQKGRIRNKKEIEQLSGVRGEKCFCDAKSKKSRTLPQP